MARVEFLFLVITFILVGVAHGRPSAKEKRSNSNGRNGEQGFVAMKTQLENALNENSASAILSILNSSLPICSLPPATPNTQPNEQGYGWLFDLVRTALAQTTLGKMRKVLKSEPKLRRELCGQPPIPAQPPADTSNDNEYNDVFLSIPAMRRKRRSLDSNAVQEPEETAPLEDEVKRETLPDENEFHLASVIEPTVLLAEDAEAIPRAIISTSNILEDGQFDESITIYPESHDQAIDQEQKMESPPEQDQKSLPSNEDAIDHEQKMEGPPEQDQKSLPSNEDAIDQEQKMESPPEQDQKSLPSNEDAIDQKQKMKSSPEQDQKSLPSNQKRKTSKLEVTRRKTEEIIPPEDSPLNENDVMSKKEMFMADEMPQESPLAADERETEKNEENDDQLAMAKEKRKQELPTGMFDELDDLKQEDWEAKKAAPEGGEIKYEVDDNPAERTAKRDAKMRLKMKLGKLRKKNRFA